jgi:hypothetical protein
MSQLLRLTYFSRVNASDEATIIRPILRDAIANNSRDNITGLLVAHRGWFVQALEGPPQAVAATYDRIYGDNRHSSPTVLERTVVAGRLFPRWSMCAHSLSPADDEVLALLGQKSSFNPALLTPRSLLKLLTTVSGVHDRALNQLYGDLAGEAEKRAG